MKCLSVSLFALLFMWVLVSADADSDAEYKSKFIINLVDYVEWPAGGDTDNKGTIAISVIGDSPLLPKLKAMAEAKTKDGKKIVIKEKVINEQSYDCQILFLASKETSDLAKVLKKVKGNPVLTVSDCEYFANYGVMINFYNEENDGKSKVKFEVNKATVSMAGLKISSKLLKLAKII
ncbi:MAG: YfiR family protein [candidate division Zixibacteria bacterium]